MTERDALLNLQTALFDLEGLRDALELLAQNIRPDFMEEPPGKVKGSMEVLLHIFREKLELAIAESEKLEEAERKAGGGIACGAAPPA